MAEKDIVMDDTTLQRQLDNYQKRLDEETEILYKLGEQARKQGLDHQNFVEIPRAADLASRTEKLLVDHLEGLPIADEIRKMLSEFDREVTSIQMAQHVAIQCRENGHHLQKCIDVGLRVGLAILTEAVLVAPLEGISEVKLLSNIDGSPFVSVHFAGPIRAAGGTAQALAVLIADMIRRKLDVSPYQPTQPEIERVKEEFALYRGNLQYRPTPNEIEEIVRACPIMINGESTESIECAGYGRVRNIDDTRIRGGVLLVIGEGMCLKAPKIRKHTERMQVPGWEFISSFAARNKKGDSEQQGFQSKLVKPNDKFMKDIIAGRPVFGNPSEPGGFRLRYGRARPSGLAAGSCNPATMAVLDDFITIGTQMKIERPGKACAITPCDIAEGPSVILDNGEFLRLDSKQEVEEHLPRIASIWDNGELVVGFGEFLENNKQLVPSGYNKDWWATDILESLQSDADIEQFLEIIQASRNEFPKENPVHDIQSINGLETVYANRMWFNAIRDLSLSWNQNMSLVQRFGCSFPPPFNPWWKDLPLEWIHSIALETSKAEFENNPKMNTKSLRFRGAVSKWDSLMMKDLLPEHELPLNELSYPGTRHDLKEIIFKGSEVLWILRIHGLVKSCLLLLGIPHRHEGDDVVVDEGWEALLEGLGFQINNDDIMDTSPRVELLDQRISALQDAKRCLDEEAKRVADLHEKRTEAKIAAETAGRQRGLNMKETDKLGKDAYLGIPDVGPADALKLENALKIKDNHLAHGSMWLVRKLSNLRWEHGASTRIGARMGRPEKAAPREKNLVHSLFPIDTFGGNQRLIRNAISKKDIRVQLGRRLCKKCGARTPLLICHRKITQNGRQEICRGKSKPLEDEQQKKGRRFGELQSLDISELAESARQNLGLDRVPDGMKCAKKLMSKKQIPESLEKGMLRAKHQLPVFRDGTIRYDMSDVPLTHFKPSEIMVPFQKLKQLGYTHDIDGHPLESDSQMLEIFPQDFIIAQNAVDFFVRAAKFTDELLERFYNMEPYYCVKEPVDLVGQLIVGLAPHTSGGVLGRIIGWTKSSGGYAHPMFHAAKRRNCDGDEDAIMLLLDGLLNFSKEILPANRGGQMDAPLVLTTRLNPTEVDKEVLNVDTSWYYSSAFYEATLEQKQPGEIKEFADYVEKRLGTPFALRGYGFTHDTTSIDDGPSLSAYKTLETMVDKMNGQLDLGQRLRSVDVRTVASSVIRSHFLPDLRGNLVAFTKQKVRCLTCGHSYRRMPLAQKCIQTKSGKLRGPFGGKEEKLCQGKLALTVTEGAVRKYIEVTRHVMKTYGVDNYTKQNVEWLAESVESLFNNDKAKQLSLADFL